MGGMRNALPGIWVELQRGARMEAAAQSQAVTEAEKLARQALRASGIDESTPSVRAGAGPQDHWASLGYFEAVYAGISAQNAARALVDRARETIFREIRIAVEEVNQLRAEMEDALDQREQANEQSRDMIRQAEQEMLDRLADFDQKHSSTDQGCMAAAGFGCGLVSLGLVAQVVLVSLGRADVIRGPVVYIGLAVATMPIVLMIMAQIVQATNRASLESQLRLIVNQARQRAEQVVRAAEAAYRRQNEVLRGQLAEAEADYRRVLAGLDVLGVPVPENLQLELGSETHAESDEVSVRPRRNSSFDPATAY